MEKPINRRNKK